MKNKIIRCAKKMRTYVVNSKNAEISSICSKILNFFLPIILLGFLCVLSFLYERKGYAGMKTLSIAVEMIKQILFSNALLIAGTFFLEKKIREEKE